MRALCKARLYCLAAQCQWCSWLWPLAYLVKNNSPAKDNNIRLVNASTLLRWIYISVQYLLRRKLCRGQLIMKTYV